jgi:hypothetical protein
MPYYISPPPQNPLSRIIAGIIAVFALIGTFIIGFAAFLVIAGIALVAGIAIWLRVAWIKRRLQKNGIDPGARVDESNNSGQVIDAEYTVISSSEDHPEK